MCATPNKRPREVTDMMAREAAEEIARELAKFEPDFGDTASVADDIIEVAGHDLSMDGYQIAHALDLLRGWMCDMRVAKTLDHFSDYCFRRQRAAEKKWAEENPMVPDHAIGATVKTPHGVGDVIEIASFYAPNSYLVQIGSRKIIVPYEDAIAAD